MANNLASIAGLTSMTLLRAGTCDNDINTLYRPGDILRINGDPRYAILHHPVFTGHPEGENATTAEGRSERLVAPPAGTARGRLRERSPRPRPR